MFNEVHLQAPTGQELRAQLLPWYREVARPLPWRESRDAYGIWISETMLQQTRVETVVDYWLRFMAELPTVQALAAAEVEHVLSLWSGLGYYSRARRLRAAALAIVGDHGGEFPRTRAGARALPGVGPYTAGAVLSMAYDLPEALVDGNVARVFSRLFALEEQPASTAGQRELWRLAWECRPEQGAGEWNQALMELGATVCTARAVRCGECPLATVCRARATDRVAELPRLARPTPPVSVSLEIAWARRGPLVLLEKRPPQGRLAGLWEPPTREVENGAGQKSGLWPPEFRAQKTLRLGGTLARLSHSITRHAIRAEVREAAVEGSLPTAWHWFGPGDLWRMALTGMAKKVLRL